MTVSTRAALKVALLGDASSINVQRWREGLEHAGLEVHTLSLHAQPSCGERVYPITVPLVPGKLRYFAAMFATRKLLTTIRPDLLIAYFVTGYGTLGMLTGFRPFVQVTAGDDILIAPTTPGMRQLVQLNLRRADLVLCWAPHMAKAVQALGIPESQIMTLPRGIPLDKFGIVRAPEPRESGLIYPCPLPPPHLVERGSPESDSQLSMQWGGELEGWGRPLRLVSTRSLFSVYKIDVLLRAVQLLRQRSANITLTIIGDGPQRQELVDLTNTLGLTDVVEFTGRISNDVLPDILAQHDLYVSLFPGDAVSASLLEGMAVGLFPLVLDNDANRLWINPGENGLLFPSLEPEAIAQTIEQAIRDIALRRHAWQINPDLIRERGDLYRNTAIYAERFRQLVTSSAEHTTVRH